LNKNLILKSGDCINETYEISVFIGKGAFGEVYRVEHKFFKKSQVMKVFNPNYVERSSLEKVLEEGQILTRLIHQNLVKVFEINTFKKNGKDYFFMTMNFVSGETLFDLLKREVHLSISTSFSIMKDVLSGLSFVHENNIIHRDINLDNILLSYEEKNKIPQAVLGDFGIAKDLNLNSNIPNAGGRLAYFAPECFLNVYLRQSDVFSAGVVFYRMLTGSFPWLYDFENPFLLTSKDIEKHIKLARRKKIKPISDFRKDVSGILSNVVMDSLNKNPEKRYSSGRDFLKALEKCF